MLLHHVRRNTVGQIHKNCKKTLNDLIVIDLGYDSIEQ